jgi:hypothetical protein
MDCGPTGVSHRIHPAVLLVTNHFDDSVVLTLGQALRASDLNLDLIPKLVRKVIDEGLWREFAIPTGEVVTWERFDDFVTTPRVRGLGTTPRLLEGLLRDDPETLKLLRDARKRGKGGRPKKSEVQEEQAETGLHCNPVFKGHDLAYGLTVLEQHEPELYAAVVAGEQSVHAALVATGRRKPYVSVRIDDPAAAARTLRKKLTVEQRHELARLLVEEH